MQEVTTASLMKAMIALKGRAERLDQDQVVESFSAVGPLFDLISTEDHQVIYGRRGTGKTHALRYLHATQVDAKNCAIFVDMRNLGSDSSIYNDPSLLVTERATRLLIDTLSFIQDGLLEHTVNVESSKISQLGPLLDRLGDAISSVRVVGEVTITEEDSETIQSKKGVDAGVGIEALKPFAKLAGSGAKQGETGRKVSREAVGREVLTVRFPQLSSAVRDVTNAMLARRVWIILDEWSSIPPELQPFLADMLRRAFFTLPKITVKIGAIEHRTKFLMEGGSGEPIGLEVTADIRSNVRLDDFLLFENNSESCIQFYKEFLFRHLRSYCRERGWPEPSSADEVYKKCFNQKTALEEFVKASEGVPRDALHIISICAQKALSGTIDIPIIRAAGHRYYQEDKSSQVEENPALRTLLQFIVDTAIRKKKTNAFLLEAGSRDKYVDLLFDRRLVHIRQRNVSSRDNPGARYFHYKIDYGCYVDLIATKQMPTEHDFSVQVDIEDIAQTVEVPTEDDARSYRRSILDIEEFYTAHPEFRYF